ncbi:MAG: hypothetical protein KGS72_28820 [Cyanobacteria bacterium REEB67]|nr:hypothetical protein [Cyanobacteria bacterium REEB67]
MFSCVHGMEYESIFVGQFSVGDFEEAAGESFADDEERAAFGFVREAICIG